MEILIKLIGGFVVGTIAQFIFASVLLPKGTTVGEMGGCSHFLIGGVCGAILAVTL